MSEDSDRPFVSVVIPARNEGEHLAGCITSLIEQDYPQSRFEVIIADGESDDNSRDIVQSFSSEHPNVLLLENPGVFTSLGLNCGIRRSEGEIIIILGAHSFVRPDFVRKNVETLAQTGADCVGGAMTSVGGTCKAQAISLAMGSPFGVGDALFRYGRTEGYVDTVAFGAYRKAVFLKIGLFDEELVRDQDDEFNYRLRKSGGKIFFKPEIQSSYYIRASLKKLWKQYFQYGLWKVRVLQKHPKMMRLRQFVPGAFVLALFAGGAGCLYWKEVLFPLLLITLSYIGVNLLYSAKLAREKGWSYIVMLPLVFATLHFSYGIGFLVGLVRFFGRWFRDELPPPCLAGQNDNVVHQEGA